MILGAMSKDPVNLEWLKAVSKVYRTLLVIDAPKDSEFTRVVPDYFVTSSRLGFGRARRLSMILCSQLDRLCIVTDGDGQYPPESIEEIGKKLESTGRDALIPERTNREVWVKHGHSILDRTEFEKFESYCAQEFLGRSVPIDMQPGLFAFKSQVVEKILPTDNGWLADWEISLKIIENLSFEVVKTRIDPLPQRESRVELTDVETKLRRIQKTTGISLSKVYRDHETEFKPEEGAFLRALVT